MIALLIISGVFLAIGIFLLSFNLDKIIDGYSKMSEMERAFKGFDRIKKIRHYGIIFIGLAVLMIVAYFLN